MALLVCLGGATAGAQSTTPTGTWTFTGIGLYAYWLGGFVPSGASINVLFTGLQLAPGLDTILEDDIGAGWQSNTFYRNADGSMYMGNDPVVTTFDQAELVNDLGIRQGILWNDSQKRNLLEAFLFYRIRYDYNAQTGGAAPQLLFASNFPDRDQILANALHAGLSFNTVATDDVHKTRTGVYGEASVEWGPGFLFNGIGSADYYRLNATFKGYVTLATVSTADGGMNLFSAFLADYLGVDFAGGSSIPVFIFESYGGRYMRASNATTIHGLDDGHYGADLKILNNLELRLVGPAVIWRDLLPAMFIFLDTGYYDGFFKDPAGAPGGILASTGAGIYIDVFDLCNLNLYFAYPFSGARVDGNAWSIGAGFNLAF
jgi:hypothetical protein